MSEMEGGLDLNLGGLEGVELSKEEFEKRVEAYEKMSEKAREMRKKIGKVKKGNELLAKFLSFLMQVLPNEQLELIYNIFFVKLTKDGYKTKNFTPNILLLVSLYVPIFKKETHEFKLDKFFSQFDYDKVGGYAEYLLYVTKVVKNLNTSDIDRTLLSKLILEIMLHWKMLKVSSQEEYSHHHKNIHAKIKDL